MPTNPPSLDEDFLKKIFIHHLSRIYNGKCFLRKNLQHLTSLASFKDLKLAMGEFAGDVEKQIARMEEIYKMMNESPLDMQCNPITSIVRDEFCLDEKQTISILNDLDLVLYVQLLEHVNITSYRMLIMIAKLLKFNDVKQLLTESFDESQDNDKLFLLIAKEYITKD
jgi:ferritin-like metal-binding protein YciE